MNIIAGAALNQTPIDWANNKRNIIDAIELASKQGIKLLCLPELCLTGYGCEDLFLKPWLVEKAYSHLKDIVPYTSGLAVNVGLPFYHNDTLYNAACMIYDGRIMGFSLKQNIANYGVHYEERWFDAWPDGVSEYCHFGGEKYPIGDVIYDIEGQKIAFEICEDAWRVKRPAHRYVKEGVNIIMNPSASPFEMEKTKIREDLVCSSSKEFNCTYIYANLLGNESGQLIFDGEIMIAKHGEILAKNTLCSFKQVVLKSFDPESTESYAPAVDVPKEEEFTQAMSLGLFDYLRKSHSRGFVLSLSGGADSSACLILVREMIRRGIDELGKEEFFNKAGRPDLSGKDVDESVSELIFCAYQGTENSSDETFNSAKELATETMAKFENWTINTELDGIVSKIEKAIGRKLTWEEDDITLQNIQARIRSPFIWMLANIRNALLLTTSNRSEGDVGYTTMDGDSSGSIAPIAGVDKPFIREYLKWAEVTLGYKSLNYVNSLQPSAELRPKDATQTDEEDLMPFSILKKIEILALKERLSPFEIDEKLREDVPDDYQRKAYISRYFSLFSRNQWKRERMAPSFHMDTFNISPRSWYRFPILSGGFREELDY